MAEIRQLENRHDVIFLLRVVRFGENFADWCRMTCRLCWYGHNRITIWRTFGRIPWHVIPEPPAGLQGAATWRIQCHDPELLVTLQGAANAIWWIHCHHSSATCHIAGCSHLAKSMSWSCHIAGFNNSIRHIENRFSPYFFGFVKCSLGFEVGGFRIVSDALVKLVPLLKTIKQFPMRMAVQFTYTEAFTSKDSRALHPGCSWRRHQVGAPGA